MPNYIFIVIIGLVLAGLSTAGQMAMGATAVPTVAPGHENYWFQFFEAYYEHARIYVVSLFVAHVSIQKLACVAPKLGLIDMPDNKRKVHSAPKPLVGGMGIVAGVLVSMVMFFPVAKFIGFMLSVLMLLAVGVLDDRYDISFKLRFVVQATATVVTMVMFPGMQLLSFGNIFGLGAIHTGILAIPITVFCVIGVINAINMTDGVDGLAGATSLIAFVAFAILAWMNRMPSLMLLSLAFAGALAAFLHFNWFPSRLFMGDAGSMTLGFVLAFFAIELSQKQGGMVSPVAVLIVLAVPVTDTVTVMTKRVLSGKSPFAADRTHFHHILKDMGLNHAGIVLVIISFAALFFMVAIISTALHLPDYVLFGMFASWFAFYFVSSTTGRGLFTMIDWLLKHRFAFSGKLVAVGE